MISNSWGGTPYSKDLEDAVRRAAGANRLFVAGAGNRNQNLDDIGFYPAALPVENVISVGAVDDYDIPVLTWGHGNRNVHISAPGIGVYSTIMPPELYGSDNGTSAATAFVSGACALVQAATGLQYLDIRTRLLESSLLLNGSGASCSQGRLDLANAVRLRQPRRVNCP